MNINFNFLGFKMVFSNVHQRLVFPVIGFLVLIVFATLICMPLLGIWAINTLFPTASIMYGFYQWLAMFIFMSFFVAVGKNS